MSELICSAVKKILPLVTFEFDGCKISFKGAIQSMGLPRRSQAKAGPLSRDALLLPPLGFLSFLFSLDGCGSGGSTGFQRLPFRRYLPL
jgi:hypothetical protein